MSLLVLVPRIYDAPIGADEPGWISAAFRFTDLVGKGDFEWSKWDHSEPGPGSSFGSLNMHVGEWLIGLSLKSDPKITGQHFSGYYDTDLSKTENIRLGRVPPAEILVRARLASAVFGALCCAVVFAIGFWAYHPVAGLLAAPLVLLNPVFLGISCLAMTDTFYNFFLLSSCLPLLALYRKPAAKGNLILTTLTGVLAGLACSVKITGIVIGSGLFLLASAWLFYRRKISGRTITFWLVSFFVSSTVTVYLLNPLFWPSWHQLRTTALVREVRSLSHEVESSKHLPWSGRDAFEADNRYPQIKNISHVFEFPLLFARWQNLMQRQSIGVSQGWEGPRIISLNATMLQLTVPMPPNRLTGLIETSAMTLFFCVGLLFSMRARMPGAGETNYELCAVPLIYWLVNYFLISVSLKLNWDRYYLPTIIAFHLIAAFGLYTAAFNAYRSIKSRRVSMKATW